MAIEERLLKLENAFATLAELAAESNARVSRSDARTSNLEKYFTMLTELAVNADERLDTHQKQLDSHLQQLDTHQQWLDFYQHWIESRAEADDKFDVKMATLAEAQMRTQKALDSLNQRFD